MTTRRIIPRSPLLAGGGSMPAARRLSIPLTAGDRARRMSACQSPCGDLFALAPQPFAEFLDQLQRVEPVIRRYLAEIDIDPGTGPVMAHHAGLGDIHIEDIEDAIGADRLADALDHDRG